MKRFWILIFGFRIRRSKEQIGLFTFTALLFVVCTSAAAQPQTPLPTIGWLGARPDDFTIGFESLRRELRALGYIEGKNIAFEYRSTANKLDRLPALADELIGLRVNVVVAVPAPAAIAAKNATRTIPIIFIGGFDPVAAGLVDSLARPGGNITGFTAIIPTLAGKRLELLKQTFQGSRALRRCGTHRIPALHNNGKKANCRQENWLCSFILSR